MRFLSLALLSALLFGCAKFPSGGGVNSGKRLTFILKVAGQINPNYVYLIAVNPSTEVNPTTQGPIPVVAAPWGNGFVAGNSTHFVRWDPTQSPRYLLYKFVDSALLNYSAIGTPISYVDVLSGGNQIQFDINLSQVLPTGTSEDAYATLQVNFLTMDNVPTGSFGGSKIWDALGDGTTVSGVNQFVNINLRTAGVYNNARFGNIEPANDTPTPDLDIIDWSVEVRNP